nr:EOG090X07NA [Eurycercus lamellatus]
MRSDEDDPVIRELPVYLSKALANKLYVFQYPLRSVAAEVDKPNVIEARIKPKVQEVELELEIPTDTPNYDRSKGEQICINVDGANKYDNLDHQNFFKGSVMDKIIYTSTKALLDPGRYAVGMITDNELHLNSIHGILHVKPTFPYLDKSDKLLKADMNKDTGADTAESGDDEDAAEQVMVKFARTETDRSKALREKSYGFLQKKNAEEQWITTSFFKENSEEAKYERNQLICGKVEQTVENLTLPKDQFISGLFGPCPESELVQKQIATESMSMARIASLPHLSDRVKHLMINVKVISFGRLCNMLEVTTETQKLELLKSLQHVAELVQGNWVVKSEMIYPSPEKDKPVKLCGLTGIHPDIMSKARDHVLHLYTLNRFVDRSSVTMATRIPDEEMKDILQQVANKTDNGWEFRLPFDQAFVDKYPDVVRRHDLMSKAKQKQLQVVVGEFKAPKKEGTEAQRKSRGRRRSRQDSCSSDSGSDTKK